jgi:hypothetical protein
LFLRFGQAGGSTRGNPVNQTVPTLFQKNRNPIVNRLPSDPPSRSYPGDVFLPIRRHQYANPPHKSFVASLVSFLQFFLKTLDCCPTKCYSIHGTPPLARLVDLLKDKTFLSFWRYFMSISFSVCLYVQIFFLTSIGTVMFQIPFARFIS